MHRETAKPPKISLRMFDIWLTEYETGMLTIRKIHTSRQLSPFEKPAGPEMVKKFL